MISAHVTTGRARLLPNRDLPHCWLGRSPALPNDLISCEIVFTFKGFRMLSDLIRKQTESTVQSVGNTLARIVPVEPHATVLAHRQASVPTSSPRVPEGSSGRQTVASAHDPKMSPSALGMSREASDAQSMDWSIAPKSPRRWPMEATVWRFVEASLAIRPRSLAEVEWSSDRYPLD